MTFVPRSNGHAVAVTLLLAFSFTSVVGCTCGDTEEARRSVPEDHRQEAWLEACIPSPQQFWDDVRGLAGSELREARLPSTLDQLAMWLSGLPEEQVRGSIDWNAPLLFVMYEPSEGRPSRESFALRTRRAESSPREVLNTGPRILEPRDGQRLFVDVEGRTLFLSPSERALSAIRAHPDDGCGPDREAIEVRVTRALLGSRQVVSWVERKGAWLEASAREATARRGRPTLGDPEVLARMLARWGEGTRARVEASGPLRITLSASPEMVEASVEGRRQHQRGASHNRPSKNLLRAIAPDAYFALTSEAAVDERQQYAQDIVDVLAQVVGQRMPREERDELEQAFSNLASAADGRVTVALRPSLEPGPLVGLAVIECSDPEAATIALTEATTRFGQGSLQNVLDHLGAHLEVGEPHREADEETIVFAVTTPSDMNEERGQVTRRLMGETPRLAWRRLDRALLVAFGPEPQPELARLSEAVSGTAAASILTQPVLARAAERHPHPELLCYGWLPSIAGLVTHGGPRAGGLPPGGFAVGVGDLDDAADSWHASVLLDDEQLRSLIRWLNGGSRR